MSTLLALFLLFFPLQKVHATDLNLSMTVGDTSFTISGTTSPNSNLTLSENHAVIGSMTADSSGNFTQTLYAQQPGLHTYIISATDNATSQSVTATYNISLAGGQNTLLDNITLIIPKPSSTPAPSTSPTPAPSTSPLPSVIASILPIASPTPTPAPALVAILQNFDFNKTGVITIKDLVPVLTKWITYWQESFTSTPQIASITTGDGTSNNSSANNPYLGGTPASESTAQQKKSLAACDINHDGTCDLFDLSILLYYVHP